MVGFNILVFVAGLVAVSAIGTDLSHLCDHIGSLDCNTHYVKGEKDEQVCGSNGVTYDNFCTYSQARCADRNMVMTYTGTCGTATTPGMVATSAGATDLGSTTPNTPGSTTPDPLLTTFCTTKNTITCPQDLDPICGSDKKFYLNQCEFSKAFCDNPSLTSEDISFCTGKRHV